MKSVNLQIALCAAVLAVCPAFSQVASHAPTNTKRVTKQARPSVAVNSKPVARVNGAVLTETDLVREMYTIFPYANQHNGFPKSMEADIRKGALDMIVFEELVYQEAKRQNRTIAPARLAAADQRFRQQFPDRATFQDFLNAEHHGSRDALRERIRRSLLIEDYLKTEVTSKSKVTMTDARTYYDQNPKQFLRTETFSIQTISFLPPPNSSAEVLKETRSKAESALKLAKAAKNSEEFGHIAEQISEDDWRVNGGDRKAVDRDKLPPEIVKAALRMKPGQVSDLIQFGTAYTMFRLNAHTPAGKRPFAEVKASLRSDMEKEKTQLLRSALGDRLRKSAKVELM